VPGNTEILDYGVSGQNIYAWIRSRSSNEFWNGAAMEPYTSANYANYDVAMPELGSSHAYVFTCPAALPADDYDLLCRLRAGATPAESDLPISEISDHWDGVSLTPIGGGSGAVLVSRYDRYPTSADLSAFLADANLTPPADQLDIAIQAGIEDLENRCMRHFLAGFDIDNSVQNPAGRRYDPATARAGVSMYGAMLDFGDLGDLARLDSVIYQPFGGTPEPWSEGTQYRAMPQQRLSGKPVRWLEILPQFMQPTYPALWGAVQVTGLWGYATKIRPDVWQAFLANGALMLFSRQFRGAGVPLGLKSWRGPEGISKEYDATMLTARLKEWTDIVTTTVPQNGAWSIV
jgi:hypothetical protein